jgi:lysophospholipase L1-like esterase
MKDPRHFSRRNFFKSAGMGAAAVAGMPLLAHSCSPAAQRENIHKFFSEGDVVLFQGDSITDAGRSKDQELPNNPWSFGVGYANHIGSWLLEELPARNLSIYNRGISGNKVYQLAERWEKDCLDLKPDILSILIGVNDYWHFRNGRYEGTAEIYENDFRMLLSRTLEALPDLKLVICQPFILTGTSAVDESWVEPFRVYQLSARKISDEFGAIWVPFQEAFDRAVLLADPTYWAADGVHPSMAGAQLMANTWLEALA